MARLAERLRAFLEESSRRLRGFPRGADSLNALVVAIVVLGLSLLVLSGAVINGAVSAREEAAEQAIRGEGITVAPESRAEDFPLVFGPGPSNRLREITSADKRLRGFPGLGDMDVISNLKHFPGTDFRCSGPSPDRGLTKQVCKSSSSDGSDATYEVTVVEQNPAVILSVEATAYDATEEEATEFLTYVAKLSPQGTDPVNAESWVGRNISSGGQYFAEGAELRLYGTERARTLETVTSGVPPERVPGITSPRPQTTGPVTIAQK